MINFIYRKPGLAYSVENVFDLVFDEISRAHSIKKTFMRYHRANARSILGNVAHARRSQSTLNHVTGDVNYAVLGLSRHNANVVTIHDLVTLDALRGWRSQVAKEIWCVLPMLRADAVTTVSDKIARDLIALYPPVEGKLHVISNPVSPSFVRAERSEPETKPRILHVGTTPNKNLRRVIAALEGLHVKLVVLGKLDHEDRKRLGKARIDFSNPRDLTAAEVVGEYGKSDLVLFPSLYEGFGLPIVEAQAVGRPVITSRLEPMMEVAAGAAVYVNPRETAEIRSAVLGLLGNAALRRELVEKGLVNARRFEPVRIADAYLNVYQSCGYRPGSRTNDD